MTTRPIKNHAASVRARLREYAKAKCEDFQRVLTRYAIERLLFRLSRTETADRYVLKGAMLFATWPEQASRPTGDLDLLGYGASGTPAVIEILERACQVSLPEDGILFVAASLRAEPIRDDQEYVGLRITLVGMLDSVRIPMQVDVAFGDHVYPEPERRSFPRLLPDLPAAEFLMYPPETVIAEKLEAMIRFGARNTRLKDFNDLWLLSRIFAFDLATLVEAARGTLRRRAMGVPSGTPIGLTDDFAKIVEERGLWTAFLRRSPPALMPPPFPSLQNDLRRFLGPLITGLRQPGNATGQWDPRAGMWR